MLTSLDAAFIVLLRCCDNVLNECIINYSDNIILTHPLGVALASSSQQIAAAGWGPKIRIPVCSKVSCGEEVGLWHDGLLGFSLCRETSEWYCCSPAIQPWGYDVVGPVPHCQGGYETGLAWWQSLGCVAAPRKGQRRSSSTAVPSDRYRGPYMLAGGSRNDAPRRQGAARQPRMAPVPLPSQPALRVRTGHYSGISQEQICFYQ